MLAGERRLLGARHEARAPGLYVR